MLWQLPLGTWLTWKIVRGLCTVDELKLLVSNCTGGRPKMGCAKGKKRWAGFQGFKSCWKPPSGKQKNSQLISLFKSKGLSVLDMVALSGGHTIGFSHCMEFMPGIYSYNKTFDIDPTMNQDYALSLRGPCPRKNLDPTVVALNDVTTAFIFDNAYGGNLQKGLGLLSTDQMLGVDSLTRPYVNIMARDQQIFFNYFVKAMIKMSNIGVKTGSNGEIRSDCGSFNG
ncbi:Peroxidase superfamily protein, putative isoform 2 [Theobroma cacao]|uniref:peroxidase n=2 Tax=Theobroma cacao TaxID=3641 RepID=A0A061E3Y2_THECC|nr:Peroxidase superfamily protein, putative isoform 2 [Theobroma cacao]